MGTKEHRGERGRVTHLWLHRNGQIQVQNSKCHASSGPVLVGFTALCPRFSRRTWGAPDVSVCRMTPECALTLALVPWPAFRGDFQRPRDTRRAKASRW